MSAKKAATRVVYDSPLYRSLFAHVHRRASRQMYVGVFSLPIFAFVFAGFYSTYLEAILYSAFTVAVILGIKAARPNDPYYQYIYGFLLASWPILFVYQSHGMIAGYVPFFLSCAVVISFQNFRLMIPMYVVMLFHMLILPHFKEWYGIDFYVNLSGSQLFWYVFLSTFHLVICALQANRFGHTTQSDGLQKAAQDVYLTRIRLNIEFAERISQSDFTSVRELEEDDELGRSLMHMRENLAAAAEREQIEKFVNVGLAEVSDILRRNMSNLQALSTQIITKLCNYMHANQGGLFLLNTENENQTAFLELKAAYAFERRKYLQKQIELGEGLVGQAFRDKDIIYLTEIPHDYLNITSGLGEAPPTSVLIVPLMANDEVMGVIELASFNEFKPYEIDFLKRVGESIASTVISVVTNERTTRLLDQSRELTEQLRSQEEEMRQNMEEIQATQEEMRRNLERNGLSRMEPEWQEEY
jgi:GAF domain-containing protein